LFNLNKRIRNIPWFLLFTVVSVVVGYVFSSHSNIISLHVPFNGYKELYTFFGKPFSHFFNFQVFWNKACTGEFMMNMLFFTAAVFLESITSMRVARGYDDRASDETTEILGLGFTNIIFGCLGLLPVSIPVARNILAHETGGNHKVYYLLSACLLFASAFLIWPLMSHFPNVIISTFNTCLAMMMIDFKPLIHMIKQSPSLSIPITILILGSMIIDILTAFSISLICFYLIYFNIGGYEYFRIEKIDSFFDDIVIKHQKFNFVESRNVFGGEEELVMLNALPNGVSHTDMEEDGKHHIEETKNNFLEDGIVYTFLGTFNFFNYEIHFNNIRHFNKSHVCINFAEILAHDLDFLAEYKSFIELLDESGYEVYITGFHRLNMVEDVTLKKIGWLINKSNLGKILYND
jgi:MFS superfamily sulfate permease-like transporter